MSDGDRLRAIVKIGFNPLIDQSVETETGRKSTEKHGVSNAVKSSTEVERDEESGFSGVRENNNVVEGYKKTSFSIE